MSDSTNKTAASTVADTLVKLRLKRGAWIGEVEDKQTSREVESDKSAKSGAVKAQLNLMTACEEHKQTLQAYHAAYNRHKELTFPWDDGSWRGLCGAHFMDVAEEMGGLITTFHEKADTFCYDIYPEYYERAVFAAGGNGLGELAGRVIKKYPSPSEIRSRFYMDLIAEPMPSYETTGRFGITYTQFDLDNRLQAAAKDAWMKLHTPLVKLMESCRDKDDKSVWFDSYLTNVRDMAQVASRLNVFNDPDLTELAEQAIAMLNGVDKDALKFDPQTRTVTRIKAEALIERMSGYL